MKRQVQKNLLLVLLSIVSYSVQSQKLLEVASKKEFNNKYDNHINAATLTSDGFHLVVGYTLNKSAGGKDIWVAKLNINGDLIWEKNFGDINNDEGTAVVETMKGDYAVVGHSVNSSSGYTEGWFLKLSSSGELLNKSVLKISSYMKLNDIKNLDKRSFAVCGVKKESGIDDNNFSIMKLSSNGSKLWQQEFGEKYFTDEALCLHVTEQKEIIAAGYTTLPSKERKILLVKVDAYGRTLFEEKIGDEGMNAITSIDVTPDNKIILAGYSSVNSEGEEDALVIIFDRYKKVISQKSFGKASADKLNAFKAYKGGYLAIGTSNSLRESKSTLYISKLDRDLEVEWERAYTPEGSSYGSDLIINYDGFTVFGSKGQDGVQNALIINYKDNSEALLSGIEGEEAKADSLKKYAVENGMSLLENVYQEEFADQTFRGHGDPLKGLNVSRTLDDLKVGNYFALIIGIDKYSGTWRPLNNAVNDAKAVEAILKSKYKFNQFKTLYNEKANRTNIISSLEWLVENVKEDDNVFIYYSGHGEFKKELNKGYWVPYGATTPSTSEYISNSTIQTFIKGIQSNHTLLVADACFSGDIFRGNTMSVPFEDSPKYYKKVHRLKSRQAMTSGGLEPVMDGGKDGHSVFAYYLLKALNENKSDMLDASQIFQKLKIPVYNNSDQSPDFKPISKSGDEGGQFIFMKK
ncbi:MAG: caspase family protein [Vicingaceae bacterium]